MFAISSPSQSCHVPAKNTIGLKQDELFTTMLIKLSKAELLQLNCTQFPFLGIFVGNRKNQDRFYYISVKSCILGGLSFLDFQLFY